MNFVGIINFSLTLICIIHASVNFYNFLNPENPSVKHYRKQLKDIEFPVIFKICYEFSDDRIFRKYGYYDVEDFFGGISGWNHSIIGWNGHTKNGTTMTMTSTHGVVIT